MGRSGKLAQDEFVRLTGIGGALERAAGEKARSPGYPFAPMANSQKGGGGNYHPGGRDKKGGQLK